MSDLRNRIYSGRYHVGATLPSRRDLAAEYGVALNTVQTALAQLIEDGTLTSHGRWGTVVSRSSAPARDIPAEEEYPLFDSPSLSQVRHAEPGANSSIKPLTGIIMAGQPTTRNDPWRMTVLPFLERAISLYGGASIYVEQLGADGMARDIGEIFASLKQNGANNFALITHGDQDLYESVLDFMSTSRDPIVWVGVSAPPMPLASVYYDHKDAGFQAADHLIAQGCRKVLFYSPFAADWVDQRIAGAAERFGLSRSGDCAFRFVVDPLMNALPEADTYKIEYEIYEKQAAIGGEKLFREGFDADAVIAANDTTAIGLMRVAAKFGLEAGRDYAIIGFDDYPMSRHLGLSTMRPPMEALGQQAATLVHRGLQGDWTPARICLHSDLIVRMSTFRG